LSKQKQVKSRDKGCSLAAGGNVAGSEIRDDGDAGHFSDDGGFGDSWLVQAVQAAASAAWEAIWVPFAETECDDNPCSRSLFVWDAASSSLAAAAAAAGSCFAEREKAREAEQAFQKKLFVEIFSPERKD
jgi:hypothetical protein